MSWYGRTRELVWSDETIEVVNNNLDSEKLRQVVVTDYADASCSEHAREDCPADRRLQRPTRVFHQHGPGQAFGRGQSDSTHATRVERSQDLDDNSSVLRLQQRVDGR
jgi:hypothetical protein